MFPPLFLFGFFFGPLGVSMKYASTAETALSRRDVYKAWEILELRRVQNEILVILTILLARGIPEVFLGFGVMSH